MGKFLTGFIFAAILAVGGAFYGAQKYLTVDRTVVTKAVAEGIGAEDVINAMLSRASEVNIKYVGNMPLYKELRASEIETGHLEIFQFCNPEDAKKMTDLNPSFAAYLPCRIVLFEREGKLYLTMMDLEPVIRAAKLEGELLDVANKVNTQLNAIMNAGATGEF